MILFRRTSLRILIGFQVFHDKGILSQKKLPFKCRPFAHLKRSMVFVRNGSRALKTFESVYDFRGDNAVHSGIDHGTAMRWKNIDGMWKIVSEK